jgi:arylsulfatase A-like enzyme
MDEWHSRVRLCISVWLLTSLAVSLPGCGRWLRPPAKPPIILIIIDTLRADHVGAYGYSRPTTPNLDKFAVQAQRYDNAQAPATWTVPSMASLFTGVYPWRHGVNTATLTGHRGVEMQPVLSDRFVTLAETLKKAGYATYGATANGHMGPQFGMAQGFDHYESFMFLNRGAVAKVIENWNRDLRKLYRRGQPFFLYVHYFDPHHPYQANKPWINKWRPNVDLDWVKDIAGNHFTGAVASGRFYEHPEEMQFLIDLYDSEVAAVDASVDQVLRVLPDLRRCLIVVTSDHGEAFGDHQNMMHGQDLYAETLRVPLFIKWPGNEFAGSLVNEPVSLVDLYPTLAKLAGAAPPDYLDGVDIRPLGRGEKSGPRAIFAATGRSDGTRWSGVLAGGFKWMRHDSVGTELLYRYVNDPTDTQNLTRRNPEAVERLRRLWDERANAEILFPPGDTGVGIDPAAREQLKNLGYINN